jgi:hypothetical protein
MGSLSGGNMTSDEMGVTPSADGFWRWRDFDTKSELWMTVFFVVKDGIIQPRDGLSPVFFEAEVGSNINDVVSKYPTNTARSIRRVGDYKNMEQE